MFVIFGSMTVLSVISKNVIIVQGFSLYFGVSNKTWLSRYNIELFYGTTYLYVFDNGGQYFCNLICM